MRRRLIRAAAPKLMLSWSREIPAAYFPPIFLALIHYFIIAYDDLGLRHYAAEATALGPGRCRYYRLAALLAFMLRISGAPPDIARARAGPLSAHDTSFRHIGLRMPEIPFRISPGCNFTPHYAHISWPYFYFIFQADISYPPRATCRCITVSSSRHASFHDIDFASFHLLLMFLRIEAAFIR